MPNNNKLNTAVIGATGFTGLDLVFLLSRHPKVTMLAYPLPRNLEKKFLTLTKE